MTPLALLAALPLATGIALVYGWALARRPSLDARLAPYVRPADGAAWADYGKSNPPADDKAFLEGWMKVRAAALEKAKMPNGFE